MTIIKAVQLGLSGNNLSKVITRSDEVSVGRTIVATGSGAAIGAAASGTLIVASAALGVAAAPVVVPLAIASGVVSCIASWFD